MPTATYGNGHIVLTHRIGELERLLQLELLHGDREVLMALAAIHGDRSFALGEDDPGDGGLTAAEAIDGFHLT
jgi:hypothetical protein